MKFLQSFLFSISLLSINFVFAANAFSLNIKAPFTALKSTTITFTADNYTDVSTFSWSAEGIADPNGTNDTFNKIYDTVGVKNVSLTITNSLGETQSTFFDINIVASSAELIPMVAITANTASLDPSIASFYANEPIEFKPLAVAATGTIFNQADAAKQRFLWNFGDPASNDSTNQNIQSIQNSPSPDMPASYIYKTAGTYTLTLIAQDNVVAGQFNALSGLATMEIAIIDRPITPGQPPAPTPTQQQIAQIYIDRCLVCHGSDGTNGVQLPISGRGPNAIIDGQPIPADQIVSADLILAAYTRYKLMELSKPVLTRTEAEEMAIFLAAKPAQADIVIVPSGAESYKNRCSICHGRGIGGYASDITPANVGTIDEAFVQAAIDNTNNRVMNNITIPPDELTALVQFMNEPVDADGAFIPQPTTGPGLYTMYCAYCHGDNGLGGALATFAIRGVGTGASQIVEAIEDDDLMQGLNSPQILPLADIQLIADTL